MTSPDPLREYYAELVERRRAYGGAPDPRFLARAEGRSVRAGEAESWERRLGVENVDARRNPGSGALGSGRVIAGRSDDGAGHGRRRPPWYLPSREASQRQTSAPRSPGSEAAREAPELLDESSGFTIILAPSACSVMEQEVLEAIWRFDSASIETGGWLYGLYPPDAERVTIAHVSGPGRNADHGIGRVRLSEPLDVERDFSDAAARAGLVRVGDWHSHPARDPIPSNGDLIAWATNGDRADVLPYASVILTPGELGWAVPEFFGWVTREDDQGFLVCEPALLSDF